MQVLFFGYGFSARASAGFLRAMPGFAGATGTVRRPDKAQALTEAGLKTLVFEGTGPAPALAEALSGTSHGIVSIAPDPAGDPVLRHHRADLDRAEGLGWLCYYSSVGVYGDAGGAWVDEGAAPKPSTARAERRLAAEQDWRDYAEQRGLPLLVLRLAGIYGPGRSALDKVATGAARRTIKPGQVFNRIHVEDIGRVTGLAAAARLAGTFNLADDAPAPPQDPIAYAASLLGRAPPPAIAFAEANMTPMQREFYRDNRRVANGAIKAALGIDLLYPDYRAGLDAIFHASDSQ